MTQPCNYVEDIIESKVLITQLVKSIDSIDQRTASTHDKIEDMSQRIISLEKTPTDKGFAAGLFASGAIMGSMVSSVLFLFGKVAIKPVVAILGAVLKL